MNQIEWKKEYNQKYWPDECKHRMRIADEVCRQTFLFDLPWDMERTYEAVTFDGEIKWDYMPGDDPEFIYQLNRHRYWICLGQAYAMTKKETYAKTFAFQLMHWIEHNPNTKELQNKTWRTIEAGLRGENWTKAMTYFAESSSVTDEVKAAWKVSLVEHAKYLADSYSPFRMQSNWGILENSGLFAIAHALPEEGEADHWKALAVQRLTEEIQLQVTEEGVHWEQSPMYHNEVLHCCLEVIRLAIEEQYDLPDCFVSKIRQMAYANLYWKKPNHCQPTMGDSDETDVRDIITKAASLFQDPVLKSGGYEVLDYESLWELDMDMFLSYEQLQVKSPKNKVTFWGQTGDVIWRSGWDCFADYLHFHCGFLGTGHGHSDKTHFDLVIGGEDVFVDCGRYHYISGETRNWFRGMTGHNVVLVDGADISEYPDAWSTTHFAPSINQGVREKDGYILLEASHLGYLEKGVVVNRKIIVLGNHLYIIVDECYATGTHTYTQQFHCHANGRVEKNDCGKDFNYACYIGNTVHAAVIALTENSHMTITDSYMSSHYNLLERNKTITVEKQQEGFTSLLTVIAGFDGETSLEASDIWAEKIPVIQKISGNVLDDCYAEAVRIKTKEKSYVIIVKHQEVGGDATLVEAGGFVALANVVVFEQNQKEGTVLCW